jgi:hypothetical protein
MKQYSIYSQNGMHYVYDSAGHHTVPSSMLGRYNEFKTKKEAQPYVDKLNSQL